MAFTTRRAVLMLLLLASCCGSFVGITWGVGSDAPNSFVSIDPGSGAIKKLAEYPHNLQTLDSAFDHTRSILYLLASEGALISAFNVSSSAFIGSVAADCSGCNGGSCCYQESFWDDASRRIIAVAVGWGGGPHVWVVGIDPITGTVEGLIKIDGVCALVEDSSAFSTVSRKLYLWLDCAPNATAQPVQQISVFDIALKKQIVGVDILQRRFALSPLLYVEQAGLVGIDEGRWVKLLGNNQTKPISPSLGGIPEDHCTLSVAGEIFTVVVNNGARSLVGATISGVITSNVSLKWGVRELHDYAA